MYATKNRAAHDRLYYNEKDYLLGDRFYPGELGMVVLLAIASLLVWSLCIWGITAPDTRDNVAYNSTADTATFEDTTVE